MYQCGPYGPNHATAGTFAFKARLLNDTRYEDHAALAEERAFLKGYTVPFVQLDPMKSILVFSHNQNTFDKKRLLDAPPSDYFKESSKTVNDFIVGEYQSIIRRFFTEGLDERLAAYEPGDLKMKPDVIEQTKKIEEERNKQANSSANAIMMNEPGKPPRALSVEETLSLIHNQQQEIQSLNEKNKELEEMIVELTRKISAKPEVASIPNCIYATINSN
jgi:hypothetical protein